VHPGWASGVLGQTVDGVRGQVVGRNPPEPVDPGH
jgi:hypothetical protein